MSYRTTDVSEFIDTHKDKIAVVCGSGPSLNRVDFSKIDTSKYVLFACCQSVLRMNRCDYFCYTDSAIPEKQKLFNHGISIANNTIAFGCAIIPEYEESKELITKAIRVTAHRLDVATFNKVSLVVGIDAVHVAANLAYTMGCNHIALLGVDLKYTDNKRYCDTTIDWDVDWCGNHVPTPIIKDVDISNKNTSITTDVNLTRSYEYWCNVVRENTNIYFENYCEGGLLSNIMPTTSIDKLYS